MTTETMTIHEALSELKIIGDRIESAIRKEFVTVNKKSNKKVNGIPIDDVVANIESRYQKVNDLIKRRNAIKRAVSISNAKTEVIISGVTYTVAEAIEMNNSGIQYQEQLMNELTAETNFRWRTIMFIKRLKSMLLIALVRRKAVMQRTSKILV